MVDYMYFFVFWHYFVVVLWKFSIDLYFMSAIIYGSESNKCGNISQIIQRGENIMKKAYFYIDDTIWVLRDITRENKNSLLKDCF